MELADSGWNLSHPDARQSKLNIHTSILPNRRNGLSDALLSISRPTSRQRRHWRGIWNPAAENLTLGGLITSGETVDPSTREDVDRVFGCKIIDRYATTEMGNVAFQCPVGGDYHVCSETILLELLNSDGSDAAEGSRGRVVLTSFYNFAMPIVRYDIGDFAIAAHGSCTCGRTLPRLASILGRQRNVFTFADRLQYSPYNWRAIFSEYVHAEYNSACPDFHRSHRTEVYSARWRANSGHGKRRGNRAQGDPFKSDRALQSSRGNSAASIGQDRRFVSLVVPPAQQQRATSDTLVAGWRRRRLRRTAVCLN